MRGNEWRFADFERIVKCFVAYVRDVYQHALAVHFTNDLFPVRGEPVVNGGVGHRVSPVVRIEMRQRHRAHTQFVKQAQDSDAIPDQMAALQTRQRGQLSGAMDAHNIVGGRGQFDIFGIRAQFLTQSVQTLERARQPKRSCPRNQ